MPFTVTFVDPDPNLVAEDVAPACPLGVVTFPFPFSFSFPPASFPFEPGDARPYFVGVLSPPFFPSFALSFTSLSLPSTSFSTQSPSTTSRSFFLSPGFRPAVAVTRLTTLGRGLILPSEAQSLSSIELIDPYDPTPPPIPMLDPAIREAAIGIGSGAGSETCIC